MSVDIPNTEGGRPATAFGRRVAALAGLLIVAGLPVAGPIDAVEQRNEGVISELVDFAGHHSSTCCPFAATGDNG